MLNVGWLAAAAPLSTGYTDPTVRERLVRLAREPTNLMRGLHYCEFCDAESPIIAYSREAPSEPIYLGSGEIRVSGIGAVYVAPTLIVHYIDAHRYRPPREFIEAVTRLEL